MTNRQHDYSTDALGEYHRAAELHHHTLTTYERVLGPDHPDTLTSRNNLAETLRAARATRNRWWPFRRTQRDDTS